MIRTVLKLKNFNINNFKNHTKIIRNKNKDKKSLQKIPDDKKFHPELSIPNYNKNTKFKYQEKKDLDIFLL
tara:strand:+ start:1200 stop:1412 length:213 start_codon:yes stop_codon:yes gene_type:complete